MNWHRFHRLGIAVAAVLIVAACGSTSTAGATDWSKQTSASGGGGMDALVAAAKAEGKLTVIALPPDWANYGAIINGFKAKYGIDVTSLNPNGSSQEEVDAFDGTSRAPDVVDVTQAVAVKNTSLFTPYQVATWGDIPAGGKEATGLWYNDYGGYMSIGYNPAKVPHINSIDDLLGPGFKSSIALSGDPTISGQGLNGVIMAAVAEGGSLNDVSKGAPHPAAARLWEEYLYSNEGQNLWLKGGARPVRQAAMTSAGTVDSAAAAALPSVPGTPQIPTADQSTAAFAYLNSHWSAAIA